MRTISQEESRYLGETRYFTGRPCANGHTAERITKTGGCVECKKEAKRRYKNAANTSEAERLIRSLASIVNDKKLSAFLIESEAIIGSASPLVVSLKEARAQLEIWREVVRETT